MHELLNWLATSYQAHPFTTLFLSLEILWVGSLIIAQLGVKSLAYIDDAETKANPVLKLFFKLCDNEFYSEEDVFFIAILLFMAVGIPLLSAAIFFWNVSVWGILGFAIMYTTRSGRRVQKKLNAHIEDKTMHKKEK